MVVSNSLAVVFSTAGRCLSPARIQDCGTQSAYSDCRFKTLLDRQPYGAMATTKCTRGSTVFQRRARAAP